jgi:hypothetical protein
MAMMLNQLRQEENKKAPEDVRDHRQPNIKLVSECNTPGSPRLTWEVPRNGVMGSLGADW